MSNTRKGMTAKDAYRINHHYLCWLIERLSQHLAQNATPPKAVNWNHVGDLGRAAASMQATLESLNLLKTPSQE